MKDLWNEIFYALKSCINKDVLEKDYENTICYCMTLLGWRKFKGEVVTQYPVQAGHETKYADIVLLKDGTEQFVIEVKRPAHELRDEDEKQLFSYMRLLKNQVKFGLYIGDKICLYYDDADSQQPPEQVFSVDIKEDNPDGTKFVELFSRNSFDVSVLTGFCKEQKRLFQERLQIQEEAAKISADHSGQLFKDALKKQYLDDGYSEEWIDAVLGQIVLSVSARNRIEEIQANDSETDFPIGENRYYEDYNCSTYDRTKYGISGSGPLAKNRFALRVISRYVKENRKTYDEYVRIFRTLKPTGVKIIKPYSDLTAEERKKRYFVKPEDRLRSTDAVEFVVTTQWGKPKDLSSNRSFDITPVVRFAESQGYEVKIYPDKG